MHWQDANEFFAMGGRGAFVWGAYGVMALLMAVEPLLARRRLRAAREAIAQQLADEAEARVAAAPAASAVGPTSATTRGVRS